MKISVFIDKRAAGETLGSYVHLRWGGNSNNRSSRIFAGSITEIDRLLPGLRYLARKRATKREVMTYAKSWETWKECRVH